MVSNLTTAYERSVQAERELGMKQGLELGEKRGLEKMVRAMAKANISIDEIAKIAKLPPDVVRKIINC